MGERQLHLFGIDDGARDLKRRSTVSLPVDTLILLVVVVVLLFVLAFSLGVEKGRKIAANVVEDKFSLETTSLASDNAVPLPVQNIEVTQEEAVRPQQVAVADRVEETVQSEKEYIIQIATYLKEEIALEEAKKLKEQDKEVSISKKGNYTVLFVGGFGNREEAQENMQSLRKRYKDCFIRRLK